jgi:catechol 2,3-dioxygenase-like lactoylglutathione lyase family enzyme
MLKQLTHSQVYVLDQDEAIDFYVGKLGMEVNTDADLGFMRWLTVNVPGQPDRQLLLEKPGPPSLDDATAEQVRELITKGAMGMAGILSVDDIHETYQQLKAKGVEFTEEPTERDYGTDCGLRDPFGNHLRIGQPKAPGRWLASRGVLGSTGRPWCGIAAPEPSEPPEAVRATVSAAAAKARTIVSTMSLRGSRMVGTVDIGPPC